MSPIWETWLGTCCNAVDFWSDNYIIREADAYRCTHTATFDKGYAWRTKQRHSRTQIINSLEIDRDRHFLEDRLELFFTKRSTKIRRFISSIGERRKSIRYASLSTASTPNSHSRHTKVLEAGWCPISLDDQKKIQEPHPRRTFERLCLDPT